MLNKIINHKIKNVEISNISISLQLPVEVKVLEAKDVQNADRLANVAGIPVHFVDGHVDFVDKPDEHASVYTFHQSITDVHRRLGVEWLGYTLTSSLNGFHCQGIVQAGVVHLTVTVIHICMAFVSFQQTAMAFCSLFISIPSSVCHPYIACSPLLTCYLYELSGRISMKLATNIHQVSRHC